jgi:transmembrane 9 superfamily member 2/4
VFQLGYPVGYRTPDKKRFCVYNHLSLTVNFHKPSFPSRAFYSSEPDNVYRVVGFEAVPMSVDHQYAKGSSANLTTCPVTTASRPICIETTATAASITYTYDVAYVESPIQWATRWDPLLKANPELKEIQWFSIVNSLMISLFLSAMVAMILLRTVYLDFARYNNIDDDEEIQDESGWKLIHGDVFRPPQYSGLLAVLVGSGAQILCMTAVTLVFALAGFLSPANRGGLLTALLTLWVFASSVCGYWSARIYSGMGGTNKKSVTLGSAFLFSGTNFVVFFAINFLLWVSGSSGAIPFLTLLLLLVMWFGISVPLNVVGAFVGYKQKPYEYPCRTNQIPREIPKTSTVPPLLFSVFAGILPFGVVFMELVFTLNSIWQNEIFYFFGFMVAVFLILAITCAELSVVMTYLTLCKEDFHHWWRSFITSGSSGLYVFGYSMVFLFTQPGLEGVHIVSTLVYSGYMLLAAFAFSLMTGCIGYAASTLFVRKLYNSVHIA